MARDKGAEAPLIPASFTGGRLFAGNPVTQHMPATAVPRIVASAFVAPGVTLIGDVHVGEDVFIGFGTVIRADLAGPFFLGPRTNIHDLCLLHGQPALHVQVGSFPYSIHIDGDVSILHHSSVHGPCRIGRNTWVGQQVSIFDAEIGADCVIQNGAVILGGARIPSGRFVAPGQAVDTQEQADALPSVPGEYLSLNASTVAAYQDLRRAYKDQLRL